MQITITINGIERTYQGDPDVLHNNDWNDIIRNMIDVQVSEEKSYAKQ